MSEENKELLKRLEKTETFLAETGETLTKLGKIVQEHDETIKKQQEELDAMNLVGKWW